MAPRRRNSRSPDHRRCPMIEVRIAEKLRELEERYRRELMSEEDRCELRDRILRLRKKLAAAARA